MKEEYIALDLVNNFADRRFELKVDNYTAFIEYSEDEDHISLIHTEVPPELEGKGVATAIIEKTLVYIEKNNFILIPLCPVVRTYIKRHPEWMRVVDERVKDL